MKQILVALLLLGSMIAQSAWSPPKNPDPNVIFREAQDDAKAGRFEDALAKQVWFHENALKIEKALYGVRMSFALDAWSELAGKYPPAMEALRKTRDSAESSVRSPGSTFESFHDAVALNRTLGESERTVVLFKWLDDHNPELATSTLNVAEPALLAAREYALCGKYVQPTVDFDRMVTGYKRNLKLSQDENFVKMKE